MLRENLHMKGKNLKPLQENIRTVSVISGHGRLS